MSTGKTREGTNRKRSSDITDPTIHLSNITTGHAEVWRGDHIIGSVESIDRPHVMNGLAEIERRWEARRILSDSYSFSTFPTRREAVNYLAEEY